MSNIFNNWITKNVLTKILVTSACDHKLLRCLRPEDLLAQPEEHVLSWPCISKHLSRCHLTQTQIKVQLPVCFKNKCQEEMPPSPLIRAKLNLISSSSIRIKQHQSTSTPLGNKTAGNLPRAKLGSLEWSLNMDTTSNYFHLPPPTKESQKNPPKFSCTALSILDMPQNMTSHC